MMDVHVNELIHMKLARTPIKKFLFRSADAPQREAGPGAYEPFRDVHWLCGAFCATWRYVQDLGDLQGKTVSAFLDATGGQHAYTAGSVLSLLRATGCPGGIFSQ